MRFEIARTDEFAGLRSGCGAFFKGTQINPGTCDQVDFDQIIIDKHQEKITVNSVHTEDAEFAIAIFVK
ncbi:hypothetical protein QUB44_15820 [Microcoleus sp. AT3-D2]